MFELLVNSITTLLVSRDEENDMLLLDCLPSAQTGAHTDTETQMITIHKHSGQSAVQRTARTNVRCLKTQGENSCFFLQIWRP